MGAVPKGYDGHKKINGRKRHIVVDTLGLVLVVVHTANLQNSPAARLVISRLAQQGFKRLNKILADSTYGKKVAGWMKNVMRTDSSNSSSERVGQFSNDIQALASRADICLDGLVAPAEKDYERGVNSHESFVYLPNINRVLKHF